MSGARSGPTGLIHLGARLYDPATGRFVCEDTVARPANPRPPDGYAYAPTDPVTAKDGNGPDSVDVHVRLPQPDRLLDPDALPVPAGQLHLRHHHVVRHAHRRPRTSRRRSALHRRIARDHLADLGGGVLVSDVMAAFPAYIRLGSTIRRAAEVVSVSEVGQLMVLDHDGRFVGSLSEEDLVRAMLPGFEDVTTAGVTLADAFRAFLERGRVLADRVIDPLVVRDAATVRSTDELARAAIVMIDRGIRRLPVVDDGALVGTLSRADLCRAVIYHS